MFKEWRGYLTAISLSWCLLLRFCYRGECSAGEAFVYSVCAVMIGLYALYDMRLKDSKATDLTKLGNFDDGPDGEDFAEVKKELEELKTRVNALVLKDGLKL